MASKIYRERHPDDEIKIGGPVVGIEAPGGTRIYPEEYSGQIGEFQRERQYISEIPKSAASIALSINDYHSAVNAGEELVDIELKKDRQEYERILEKQRYEIDLGNDLVDTQQQFISDLHDARQRAKETGNPNAYTEFLSEVLETYRNPEIFEGNPAGQDAWQKVFTTMSGSELRSAQNQGDIARKGLREFNFDTALNNVVNSIYNNKLDFQTATRNAIPTLYALYGQDPIEMNTQMNRLHDAAVKANADIILESIATGKVSQERGIEALNDLMQTGASVTYDWIDEKGNRIKGADGEFAGITVTLSDQTQYLLRNSLKSALSDIKKQNALEMSDFIDQWNTKINKKDFDETGSCDYLLATTYPQMLLDGRTAIEQIHKSNLSDTKKNENINHVIKTLGQMAATKVISNIVTSPEGPGSSGAAAYLVGIKEKLQYDMKTVKDWSDYKLTLPGTDFSISASELPVDFLNDRSNTSREYFAGILQSVNTLLSGVQGNSANLWDNTDSEYRKATDGIITEVQKSNTWFDDNTPGQMKLRAGAMDGLKAQLKAKNIVSNSLGLDSAGVSDREISAYRAMIDTARNPEEKLVLAQGLAEAIRDSGNAEGVMTALYNKPGAGATDQLIGVSLFLSAPGLEDIATAFKSSFVRALSQEDKQENGFKVPDKNIATISDILKKYKIPLEYEQMLNNVAGVLIASAQQQGALGMGNKGVGGNWDENFKRVIDTNFTFFSSGSGIQPTYKFGIPPEFSSSVQKKNLEEVAFQALTATTRDYKNARVKGQITFKIKDQRLIPYMDGYEVHFGKGRNSAKAVGGISLKDIPINPNLFTSRVVGAYINSQLFANAMVDNSVFRKHYSKREVDPDATYAKWVGIEAELTDPSFFKDAVADLSIFKLKPEERNEAMSRYNAAPYQEVTYTPETDPTYVKRGLLNYANARRVQAGKIRQTSVQVPTEQEATAIINRNEGVSIHRPGIDPELPIGMEMEGVELRMQASEFRTKDYTSDLIEKGNIDTKNLPVLQNEDGTVSTVATISISEDGKEVLIPTVIDGKRYSTAEAVQHYKKTGQHLGKFASVDAANDYAQSLHLQEEARVKGGEIEGTPTGGAAPIGLSSIEGTPTGEAAPVTYTKQDIYNIADATADKYGMPRNIIRALIKQESGGQVAVTSNKGATGVMQLMPATAKGLGVTDILNPYQNIDAGVRYLKKQYETFGSWPLALAAYNAGPGNVRKHKGIPPFKETQNYVRNISKIAGLNKEGTILSNQSTVSFDTATYMDTDTGLCKLKKLDGLTTMLNQSSAYKDKVVSVQTNRPELLEDKPEYADFSKYRKMKGKGGKPLFVKGDSDKFVVIVEGSDKVAYNPAMADKLAKDMVYTQAGALKQMSLAEAQALLVTFGTGYDKTDMTVAGGMANLTTGEYMNYGIPASGIFNPVMQARVLAQEFQRANDVLGSPRKAVFALAGGDMVNAQGKVKSWREIKAEKTAIMSQWFMSPSSDTATREQQNNAVETFDRIAAQYERMIS